MDRNKPNNKDEPIQINEPAQDAGPAPPDKRVMAMIAYITWLGWIVALIDYKKGSPFFHRHINQALVLNLAASIGAAMCKLPGLPGIVGATTVVLSLLLTAIGIVRARNGDETPIPGAGIFNWVE